MQNKKRMIRLSVLFRRIVLTFLFLLTYSWMSACNTSNNQVKPMIVGRVVDQQSQAIEGARVRIQTTEHQTVSAADGSFSFLPLESNDPITITAWTDGFYNGWTNTSPGGEPITISLKPYYSSDNPDYNWFSHEGAEGSVSCSHCMPCYEEWKSDAHSQSATNPRFLTMYEGTDLDGNQSPATVFINARDYGTTALPPDLSRPYYGPGYKLDFPDTAGNCAACHTPAAVIRVGSEYQADPTELSPIEEEGIFCEFCHKVGQVNLDLDTQLPYPNMPGVLSMRLYRPQEDEQLFFGNFDDVTRRVSYNPLYEQSAYCASCHHASFWDTQIYNSYGEWLESPYSDPLSGKTCQDCHMPPVDYNYFVYPEKGGLLRNPEQIRSHLMLGIRDEDFMRDGLSMQVAAKIETDQVLVQVDLTNDNTGHHIPTGSPMRHLILLVRAFDSQGIPLQTIDGPTLPDWIGIGDPQQGYFAGLPGKTYAKVLQEKWTGISPTGAYWNPVRIISDNRLAAFESDISHYHFISPPTGIVTIEVTLLYRRAFIDLMDQKGWEEPDLQISKVNLKLENQE